MPRVHGSTEDESGKITLCRECHGLMHNVEWSLDHAELIRVGMQRVRSEGKSVGRPKLDPTMRREIAKRFAAGDTAYRIGKDMGISKHTAAKYAVATSVPQDSIVFVGADAPTTIIQCRVRLTIAAS
jgi:hypothetical protein